jgi:hypothetical protein
MSRELLEDMFEQVSATKEAFSVVASDLKG